MSTLRSAGALLALLVSVSVPALGQETGPDSRPATRPNSQGGKDDPKASAAAKPRAEMSLPERVKELEAALDAVKGKLEEREQADLMREAEAEAAAGEAQAERSLLSDFMNQSRLNALNPRMTVFGDIIARVAGRSEEGEEDDRVSLKEVELDFRADIDPFAKGVVIAAFEEEDGEYEAGIEEGYVTFETLPWSFGAKIGRHRVPFGHANQLHNHDLPWTDRPLPLLDFFGEEGYVETGAILDWAAPAIGPAVLTLEGSILNGENETILAGSEADEAAYRGRAEIFITLNDATFASLGGNLLFGYNSSGRERQTVLWSGDLLLRWKPSEAMSIVAFGELFGLSKEVVGGGEEHPMGGYGALQVQVHPQVYVGGRYDFSEYDQQIEDADHFAISGYVSAYTTEFLRLRVGYRHHERQRTRGVRERDEGTFFFQLTFIFGSHPVEPFWFNK